MRHLAILTYSLLSLVLVACSGVQIQQSPIEQFAAGSYHYYMWRTAPLPQATQSSDALYAVDPVLRQEVDAQLQRKGYVLDVERAQFTVDYLYVSGMLQGERSALASNISPIPRVLPNRPMDQASVDNAIALGGVKEANSIVLQFNDRTNNREVWQVTLTSIVENANSNDTSRLDDNLQRYLTRALQPLPQVPRP